MIESYGSIQINVPFSIKRTLFQIFKKSLLNVPFNLEKEGLNIYEKGTYNREQRVEGLEERIKLMVNCLS